jgi:hypothetical protein
MTAVTGGPMMGKSATLRELARQLRNSCRYTKSEVISASGDGASKSGNLRPKQGDNWAALTDYTEAIELPGARMYPIKMALYNREICRRQTCDSEGAIADREAYSALLKAELTAALGPLQG